MINGQEVQANYESANRHFCEGCYAFTQHLWMMLFLAFLVLYWVKTELLTENE